MEYLGYYNFLFDSFVLGERIDNLNLLKPQTATNWFKHTEDEMEKAMAGGKYYNIDFVSFCNHIELDIIKETLSLLWESYRLKYPYGTKEDYKKHVWQHTIFELSDFIEEDKYFMGYSTEDYDLYFCRDKYEVSNNFWFFIEEKYTPEFFNQYYKVVLQLINDFIELDDSLIRKTNEQELIETVTKPFRNIETQNLFNFIVSNWENESATKWGYLWNFIFENDYGKLTSKTDYETYIRTIHKFTKGKPNYEACNSPKRIQELTELYMNYKKK